MKKVVANYGYALVGGESVYFMIPHCRNLWGRRGDRITRDARHYTVVRVDRIGPHGAPTPKIIAYSENPEAMTRLVNRVLRQEGLTRYDFPGTVEYTQLQPPVPGWAIAGLLTLWPDPTGWPPPAEIEHPGIDVGRLARNTIPHPPVTSPNQDEQEIARRISNFSRRRNDQTF